MFGFQGFPWRAYPGTGLSNGGASPVFFVPRTLGRTWGTRPALLLRSLNVLPSGATVCFCQGREGWFGCGKGADEVRLGNAVRFPLSPNAAATGSLRQQNRSRWRFSKLLACFSSFGIESDQEFMSQSDTDYFFCFAGCS